MINLTCGNAFNLFSSCCSVSTNDDDTIEADETNTSPSFCEAINACFPGNPLGYNRPVGVTVITKLDELKTLGISQETIEFLTDQIQKEGDEQHKKVLVDNIQWYACACDCLSNRLAITIEKKLPKCIIINADEPNCMSNWLMHVNRYFELHKNSNKNNEFIKDLASFEDFYNRYNKSEDMPQRLLYKHEIKGTLLLEDMDEDFLDEILKWKQPVCLNEQFNTPLDLLKCTDYTKLQTMFSSKTPPSNGSITRLSWIFHKTYVSEILKTTN